MAPKHDPKRFEEIFKMTEKEFGDNVSDILNYVMDLSKNDVRIAFVMLMKAFSTSVALVGEPFDMYFLNTLFSYYVHAKTELINLDKVDDPKDPVIVSKGNTTLN